MYNEKQIENIFHAIHIKPDEDFAITTELGTVLVKKAYISERLYMVDMTTGNNITDKYLLPVLRGTFKTKKLEESA